LAGLVDTRQSLDLVLPTLTHNLLGSVHLMTELAGSRCQRVIAVTSAETPRPGQSPNSPYAASKQAMVTYAEMYGALFGLPVVLARPHMVFGPHQPSNKLIPHLIRCGLEHTPPQLSSGKRICDPVYVKDFVRALLYMALASRAPGLTLDVGTGVGLSVAEIAARVLSLAGATLSPVFGVIPDRVDEASQVADLTSTQAVLPWRPLWSFDEAIRETIDWYAARRDFAAGGDQPTSREVSE
jgi:dTDP-glucose 4,6-dehydratase